MIWTENWGQRPLGNIVATVTIGGHEYQVWRSGSGDGGVITYLSTTPQLSGNMPLSEFFKDVQNRGWRATTTWQVDYGVATRNGSTSQTSPSPTDLGRRVGYQRYLLAGLAIRGVMPWSVARDSNGERWKT
jgi:hypothetical protein